MGKIPELEKINASKRLQELRGQVQELIEKGREERKALEELSLEIEEHRGLADKIEEAKLTAFALLRDAYVNGIGRCAPDYAELIAKEIEDLTAGQKKAAPPK
jgi:hypothetical protein